MLAGQSKESRSFPARQLIFSINQSASLFGNICHPVFNSDYDQNNNVLLFFKRTILYILKYGNSV